MPDPAATADQWREYCIKRGLGNPYLIAAKRLAWKTRAHWVLMLPFNFHLTTSTTMIAFWTNRL